MNKSLYPLGGLVVGVVIAVIAYGIFSGVSPVISSEVNISNVGENAFGELKRDPQDATLQSKGIGGGGGGFAESASMVTMGMPNPGMVNYEYKYEGDLPTYGERVDILKKVVNTKGLGNLTNLVAGAVKNVVDLSTIGKMNLSMFEVRGEGKNSYNYHIDLVNGMISINKNWLTWEDPMSKCHEPFCYDKFRLKIEDIPKDIEVIKLADAFIKKMGIGMEIYGEPEIDDDWRIYYDRLEESAKVNYYVPEVISVMYPLKINDRIVYNDWGDIEGMRLSVDVRLMAVEGLWGLSTQEYEAGSYLTEQEEDAIRDVMERGGLYGYSMSGPRIKNIGVALKDPTPGYMKYWKRSFDTEAEEMLVPALVFEVENEEDPDLPYYQSKKRVIVPIVKDILEFKYEEDRNSPVPILRTMEAPAMEEPATAVEDMPVIKIME